MTQQRILVVDDEQIILFAIREYLKALGYKIDCAADMEAAQALISDISYRAVLVDLRLAGVDGVEGLEVVSFIRAKSPMTRIIVLTAYGSPEIEQEALRRGADLFLHKPVPMQDISQKLLSLLR